MNDERVEGYVLAACGAQPHGPAEPIGGRGTRTDRITAAERGALFAGCSDEESAVFLWLIGFDGLRKAAYYAILAEACRQWDVYRRDYGHIETTDDLRELAALVFDEIRKPPAHCTKSSRARWMAVSLGVWGRRYERAHRRLSGQVDCWLSAARTCINKRRATVV